jgi:hypothetical protein
MSAAETTHSKLSHLPLGRHFLLFSNQLAIVDFQHQMSCYSRSVNILWLLPLFAFSNRSSGVALHGMLERGMHSYSQSEQMSGLHSSQTTMHEVLHGHVACCLISPTWRSKPLLLPPPSIGWDLTESPWCRLAN